MKSFLFRCIGIFLFLYLMIWVVDIEQLFSAMRSMNPWIFVVIIPIHFFQWTLRVWRWQVLLRSESIWLPFWQTLAVSTSGFFFGCMTPGRMGEFAKVKFLMNAGHPFRGAFMSTFIERLMDIFALLICLAAGIWVGREWIPEKYAYHSLFLVMIIAGGVFLLLMRRKIKAILLSKIPENVASSIDEKVRIWTHSLRSITVGRWLYLVFYSIVIWGLNFLIIYLLFHATEFSLSMPYAFAFAAFGSLAGMIPATVYGVGIRESMLIGLFTLIKHPHAREAAILFGLMYYVLLVYHIILGFIGWISPWMKPFIEKHAKP